MSATNGEVRVVRFTPGVDEDQLSQLVHCYRVVFGEPPWNEWMTCKTCNQKWGMGQPYPTIHCGAVVTPFWPEAQVRDDLQREITSDASAWLALVDGQVVGFCWGYPISPDRLAEQLSLHTLPDAIKHTFGTVMEVGYQDEIGMMSPFRSQGIARRMFLARNLDFHSRGLPVVVLRTMRTPPTVTYQWYRNRLGYHVIDEYHNRDDLVILGRLCVDFS